MCYVCAKSLQLCLTLCDPMDWFCQASLSMGFSRQEYWSGLPCPPSGDLPTQGSKPRLLPLLHHRQILYCWASREDQNKKTRYILVQLLYGRWHISWRWHLNILWLGDFEMNFGIREAWIKFKLWLFLWENYLVSLHLCFPSIKPPLSIVVGFRDSFVHSRIYSVIKCLLNIG